MRNNNTIEAFFALVRGGLWEQEVNLSSFGELDYTVLLRLAEEQSVIGQIAAGLEHVVDEKAPKEVALQFVGQALQLEQQNKAMNSFIGMIIDKMRKADIYALLLKGQGIAQCYERPLWRSCGDVDLFLSEDNYKKTLSLLKPLASTIDKEGAYNKHIGMTIDSWVVELHGTLRCGLSSRVDRGLDAISDNVFYGGAVRSWANGNTQVFIPSADNDAIYIFTHILQHFFKGGIGLRQICDWCRLIWTYHKAINKDVMEMRLKQIGIMSEWQAFGAFAVDYLGLPTDVMPFYSSEKKWKRKAKLISDFVIKSGNFGHNRDTSYYSKYPYIIRKMISMGVRTVDLMRHARLFPLDSLKFFPRIMFNGLTAAFRGE